MTKFGLLGLQIQRVAIGLALLSPAMSRGAPLWETTFKCAPWNQSLGLSDSAVCATGDGIAGYGGWTTAQHPNGDELTAAANNALGGGGLGFRHWRCDGQNCNGGSLGISLPSPQTELWLRFYMRYQAGFGWDGGQPNYTKDIYWIGNTAASFTIGFHGSSFGVAVINPGSTQYGPPGWTAINSSSAGDGLFHCYETHVRMDTNGADGVVENWVDGVAEFSSNTVNFNATGAWQFFALGENQSYVDNGGADAYTDYDDLVVSNTGPVGCLPIPDGGLASDGGSPSDAGVVSDGGGSGADGGGTAPDAGVRIDAGAPSADAGPPAADAGAGSDGGAPLADGGPPVISSGGSCGCASNPSDVLSWAVIGALLLRRATRRKGSRSDRGHRL